MKKIILLTLFISIPIILICQTDWTLLNSGTTQDLISIDFFDANIGLIVGDNGLILKTTNGGETWDNITSGTSNNLNGISYVNADTAVVVGDGPTILHTTDGGENWVPITIGIYGNLFSVDIDAGGNGIAGGTDQTILKTDDAGATWTITQTGYMGGGWQGAQMVDESIGFVFGSNSIFQPFVGKTTNSGTSFSFYNFYFVQGAVSYEGKLYDGYFFDDFNGITAGRRWDGYGCISSTSDLNNWTTQHFPTSFYGIDFSTETDGYVVGNNGTIMHTTDGGTVWEAEDSGVFSQLNSVLFVNEDLGFIAGNGGVILRKQENTIYVSGDVNGIWSADTVYVVGEITIPDGEVLTIDPGTYIEFQGHYKFNVQGQILAVGNEQDSICFTAINHDEGWHGVRFDNTPAVNDSSKFYYCNFEYGKATGTEFEDRSGGALYFKNYDKVHIANSSIYNNFATLGAGICCSYYSSPLIEFNDISNNSAGGVNPGDGAGAGIYMIDNSSPMIQHNIISNNTAYGTAGILCQNDSNPIIINNSISENGGLMYVGIGIINSNPLLINNLIANNYAEFIGGGITCASYFSPVMINNTIVNNYACNGGGIVCGIDSTPQLINNIIWDNSAVDGDQIYLMGETSDPDFYYCNVQGGISEFGGEGAAFFNGDYENCIDLDPLFWGTGEYPYSLLDDSPCVNTGTPDTTGLNLPEFDLAGNPRIFGGRIDMGAYENQNVIVNTDEDLIPLITKLNQNYPNPFNPETTITFFTAKDAENAELVIYNVKGQKVKQLVSGIRQLPEGQHSVVWNGKDDNGKLVSSGIYFYKLKTANFEKTRKMVLMK